MYRYPILVVAILSLGASLCRGQVAGNIGYSQGGAKARAEARDRANRTIADHDRPPTSTSTFVEAHVLMNVKADEYVAVFGLSQEGDTVSDCNKKMDEVVKAFTEVLTAEKVGKDEIFLDFISQTKIYGFEIAGNVATEKLVGFELKKNLSIRYKDRELLDRLIVAAAQFKIYDLIKVDYVVKDLKPIQDKLVEEASKIIKDKTGRYEKLLGVKLQPPAQVYLEKFGTFYPTSMYDSFTAAEVEAIGAIPDRQRFVIHSARKSRTFVFNGLDGDGFDTVINPVVLEPVVQFTLHLKMKYEVEPPKAK